MLYLHETPPSSNFTPGRVRRDAKDFGSLSLEPPPDKQSRDCGDVVAFASAPGLFPRGRYRIHEVLYRVWWSSGTERAAFSLNLPGHPAMAQVSVAACEIAGDHPSREEGMVLTTTRVPVDLDLTEEELARLYFTLDASHSMVQVTSGPGRSSMIVLNPPSAEKMKGQDLDKDSVDDFQELGDHRRDPFRADPPTLSDCLAGPGSRRPAVAPLTPLPEPQQLFDNLSVSGDTRFINQVIRHSGTLLVSGSLTLQGSTLLLAKGTRTTAEILKHVTDGLEVPAALAMFPRILVQSGGTLVIKQSTIAAMDPAVGFTIQGKPGAKLIVQGSRFLHPGFIFIGKDNKPIRRAGLVLQNTKSQIRGNTFLHGLNAVLISGPGVVIENNRFAKNSIDIRVVTGDIKILGNKSLGSGIFVFFGHAPRTPHKAWIKGNLMDWCMDTCITIPGEDHGITMADNEIRRTAKGVTLVAPAQRAR